MFLQCLQWFHESPSVQFQIKLIVIHPNMAYSDARKEVLSFYSGSWTKKKNLVSGFLSTDLVYTTTNLWFQSRRMEKYMEEKKPEKRSVVK